MDKTKHMDKITAKQLRKVLTAGRGKQFKLDLTEIEYAVPDGGCPVLMVEERIAHILTHGKRIKRSLLDKIFK